MKDEYIIRRMSADEVQLAIDWAAAEGWNPGLSDAACFYAADNQGFFIGLLDDEPIAVGAAVVYDDTYAFCGLYIVKPEYRGQGFGMALTHARLKYVGDRCVGLDGVLEMTDKYANLGYRTAHKNVRYALTEKVTKSSNEHIHPIQGSHIDALCDYDQKYFPAPRKAFLKTWITQPEGYALAYFIDEKILGYGLMRKVQAGYKIGPLFAETEDIAESLFQHLASRAETFPVLLDIPEPNEAAKALVKKYKMEKVFETLRMYRNGPPDINLDNIYGITTFELG